jgi:hypothetical protein
MNTEMSVYNSSRVYTLASYVVVVRELDVSSMEYTTRMKEYTTGMMEYTTGMMEYMTLNCLRMR